MNGILPIITLPSNLLEEQFYYKTTCPSDLYCAQHILSLVSYSDHIPCVKVSCILPNTSPVLRWLVCVQHISCVLVSCIFQTLVVPSVLCFAQCLILSPTHFLCPHVVSVHSWKPISQSCAVAKSETFWQATGQSNLAYRRLSATKASKVWFSDTQLHFGQWNSPLCLPSLTVQWAVRIFHFYLLRMIEKQPYMYFPQHICCVRVSHIMS